LLTQIWGGRAGNQVRPRAASSAEDGFDGASELGRDLVRLRLGQAEGRRETEDIALRHGPRDDAFGQERTGQLGPDPLGRVEEFPRFRVLHEFDRAEQPLATHFAHMGVIAHLILEGGLEVRADGARVLDQVELVDQLEVGDPRRRADRVGRVGPAVADGAVLVGPLLQHLPHLVRHDGAGQRRVGRGEALGDGDEVGFSP
jgi:hypothetical protein